MDALRVESLTVHADGASPIDGAFKGTASLAAPGVYEYSDGVTTWTEWTPPHVLADPQYVDGLKMLPVTLNHPAGSVVTADNVRSLMVGALGDSVRADPSGVLQSPIAVHDAAAAKAARTTHRQISLGYRAVIDWTAGVTPQGQRYDAKQTKRLANHVALVEQGRHGPRVRIHADAAGAAHSHDGIAFRLDGDGSAQPPLNAGDTDRSPKREVTMALVKLGNLQVDVADVAVASQVQAHVDALTAQVDAAKAEKTRADSASGELAAVRAALETAKADHAKEIDKIKADAKADARARIELEAKVTGICGEGHKCDGKTDDDLRKDALAKLGVEVPADATGDYLKGALAFAAAQRKADSPASVFGRDMNNRGDAGDAGTFDSNKL